MAQLRHRLAKELAPIVDAWNQEAKVYPHKSKGGSTEWGHLAMPEANRERPDAGFRQIEIQDIHVSRAHYEFIVRAREGSSGGAGGVIGIELHIEPHAEEHLRLVERLRSEHIRTFPRISAEHWVFRGGSGGGDRLSFVVPASIRPAEAVKWMRTLILATRDAVRTSLLPAR